MLKKLIKFISKKAGIQILRLKTHDKGGVLYLDDPIEEQRRLLGGKLSPLIVDVGAHWGQTAALYSKVISGCLVYSFEPFEESYGKLVEKVRNLPNVKTFNVAVSDKSGQGNLNVTKSSAASSLLAIDPRASSNWNGTDAVDMVRSVNVRIMTLDEINRVFLGSAHIDILKIDAQGSEPAVMRGAVELCRARKIGIVYMEILVRPTYVGQSSLADILGLMGSLGYELHNFYNPCFTDNGELNQLDALFKIV